MTKPIQKQRIFTKINFADHNYNYVNRPQTSKTSRPNTQNHLISQRQKFEQPTTTSVNFHDYPRNSQEQSENYPFFQQNKNNKQQNQNKHKTPHYTPNYLSSDDDDYYQPDIFAPYTQEYLIQQPRLSLESQNSNFYPQNPTSTQPYQTMQIQNPASTHSYHSTQMPNTAESLQITMNPYLIGGSSITSYQPLMVFTGTEPENAVEDYLKAVTANLILNIGPEPINTPLHRNWIHRRTALIQTILDGAARKWFSVLPIDIKSDWKRFTQEFSKMFDSERNKQHQSVLCNEIQRLPNETIKQLAVKIETLVRESFSLNTRDYKNTKRLKLE